MQYHLRNHWRRRPDRRGVTLIEFALAFPILMIFTIGMIEFVRMHMLYHAADNAAYEAARHVIVPGAKESEAVARAEDLIETVGVRGTQFTISPDPIVEQTSEVTVRVRVPLAQNSWLPPALTRQRVIERQCTLMTERIKSLQARAVN